MAGNRAAALGDPSSPACAALLVELESSNDPLTAAELEALVVLLGARVKAAARRAAGALARRCSDPTVADALFSVLGDASPMRSWSAAFALHLGGVSDPRVGGAALAALGNPDGDVRWAAAEIVRDAHGREPERIGGALLELAESGGTEARKMALYCLRDLGSVDQSLFSRALEAGEAGIRLAALAGLLAIGKRTHALDDASVLALAAAYRAEDDAGARRGLLVGLGYASDAVSGTTLPLIEAARDQRADPALAKAATMALRARSGRRS